MARQSIAQIRQVIDACNWSRNDLGGATPAEFLKMDVAARMAPHIAAVRALEVPARFARDVVRAAEAIEYAERVVARWNERRAAAGVAV